MKQVKVLGAGACSSCEMLKQRVAKVISDNSYDANVEKVTDIVQIMNYGVMAVPVLVIDEDIKSVMRIPTEIEIKEWLK